MLYKVRMVAPAALIKYSSQARLVCVAQHHRLFCLGLPVVLAKKNCLPQWILVQQVDLIDRNQCCT
jgi:hypothetical protein